MPYKDPEVRNARHRKRYATEPAYRAKYLEHGNDWNKADKERHARAAREYNARLKTEVITHYGGKCACCGETILAFLAVDHLNGDGNKQRRTGQRSGVAFYRWLKRNGYPPEYQVLCHNCNQGKYINGGVCPHEG